MIMTLHGMFTAAGICILLAMACDACDGRSARALGVAGEFGKELDSLSDVVSFGAASAFLVYTYSLQELGWIGVVPAIIYAALGGIRLARFNLNTGVIHGYFQGMPIPNGGCLIATYVISGVHLPAWLIGIFVVALGYHLVSKIHNPDFKGASPDVLHKSALAISLIFGAVVLVFRRLAPRLYDALLVVYRVWISQYGHERRFCALIIREIAYGTYIGYHYDTHTSLSLILYAVLCHFGCFSA